MLRKLSPFLFLTVVLGVGCLPVTNQDAGVEAGHDAGTLAPVWIHIFHTADEHGWLQPSVSSDGVYIAGGVANLVATWRDSFGFDPSRDLLLSGGDNWVGSAISTWFDGEPAVAALNAMGYRASAAGNHEFDKGTELFSARSAQAAYPYLGANVLQRSSGQIPDFLQPWVLLESSGVRVGVLGLALQNTATAVNPIQVADLEFIDPVETVDRVVPDLRAAGAQVVVLLTHECSSRVAEILGAINVKVDLAFAAHCHQLDIAEFQGIPIVSSGRFWRAFSVSHLRVDTASGEVLERRVSTGELVFTSDSPNPVEPDPGLSSLVEGWQQQLDDVLAEQVGYTTSGIAQGSATQTNWVTDAWRWAFPQAQVALQNVGGLRQALAPGPITRADIVGMMPFDNLIYEVRITGAELQQNLLAGLAYSASARPAVSGLSYAQNGDQLDVTLDSGAALDPVASYRVLVNDFMYNGGGGYLFATQDPDPLDTAQNYRQPLLDWCLAHPSDAASPVESHLDPVPRG
ncbi:MAG: bifunctional UDP-sugar hydrolase/5'-nucleotidase [Pseudomonadota bacterium]